MDSFSRAYLDSLKDEELAALLHDLDEEQKSIRRVRLEINQEISRRAYRRAHPENVRPAARVPRR